MAKTKIQKANSILKVVKRRLVILGKHIKSVKISEAVHDIKLAKDGLDIIDNTLK